MGEIQEAKQAVSWVKQHEKLIALALIALTFYGTVNKVENILLDHAQTKAALTLQQANDQKDANAQVAKAVNDLKAQYDASLAALTKQNAELANAVALRNTQLGVQQQKNETATPSELANRWKGLINGGVGDITYSSGNGFTVSPVAAVTTVNQLEEVPVLQANLKDAQTQTANATTQLTAANGLVAGLNNQVAGLRLQIADDDKACKAQVTEIKRKARVSKAKWFGAGFIAGFVSAVGAIVR